MTILFRICRQLFDSRPTLIANSFLNNSSLKTRIQMLINPKTNRRALWRYVLVLPVAALLLMCSQQDAIESELLAKDKDAVKRELTNRDEVFLVVEQNPEPQGGFSSLNDYLGQNLRYPEAAQKANVQGKVFVSFVVAADGGISDVQILKGLGFGCDQEAVRVIKQMPNWKPGQQSGRAVKVKFNLPIAFTLDEEEAAKANSGVVDNFLAKFDRFTVNGKVVDKSTFAKAFGKNPREISNDPSRRRISITTR
ncbi:MAG: energy transducer TonB [Bacteroidetes bacterium]|nr:energy transducer TonB [Fibrella sp.]